MNKNQNKILKNDEVDLRSLIIILWNDRKRILRISVLIMILGILYALLSTPLFKSNISMYSVTGESGTQFDQLKGMASTLGINVGGASAKFNIPDIIKSRRLKSDLIFKKWKTKKYNEPVNLLDYWEINDTTKTINLNPLYKKNHDFDDKSIKEYIDDNQENLKKDFIH